MIATNFAVSGTRGALSERLAHSTPLSPARSYGAATATFALAYLLQALLAPSLGSHAFYLTFTVAIILTGRYGGRGPALAATGLSIIGSAYLLWTPPYSRAEIGHITIRALPFFSVVGICISVLTGQLHDALKISRNSEQQLRRFAMSAPVAIAMFDREMRYLAVSERFRRDNSLEGLDVVGKCHYDLFPEIPERWRQVHRRCLAGATERNPEDPLVRRDGSTSWISWEVTPWYQADGNIGGIVLAVEDVTFRRQAEEALRESEERFRTLFENAADGIFIAAPDGRYTEINARGLELTGYSREEFVGMHIGSFVAESERHRLPHELERVKSGQPSFAEWQFVRKDGSTFPGEVSAQLLPDGRLLASVRDLSDRRRLERQFIQAQKLEGIGRLAGGVAHDFNNLLTIIRGYAQMGLDKSGLRSGWREPFQEIVDAANRAAGLTRQLLAFSRNQIIEPRNVVLDELVQNFEKMLRRIVGEDIDLALALNADEGVVRADPGRIEQVILNLVVNARDAMPQGGKLRIRTSKVRVDAEFAGRSVPAGPGVYIALEVSDTGAGMSEQIKSHLFEPFFTTKEPGKGTGLGLSTVYGIVKQSGGAIFVDSEEGKGSTFRILFPAVAAAADAAPEESPMPANSGTETILLAEDEPGVRRYVRYVLEQNGYRVIEAATGRQALASIRNFAGRLHALVTDLVMPEMGGVELIAHLEQERPDLPVLCLSGYTDRRPPEKSRVALLLKPFTAEALLKGVREMIDGREPTPATDRTRSFPIRGTMDVV